MKKAVAFLIVLSIIFIGLITAHKLFSQAGEILSGTRFNWYESKTHSEIENGNKFAQERLSKKFHIFVNGIFIDVGYDWDGIIYVPIRSISDSLGWFVDWLPDLGVIQLLKDDREAYVDIVNFFGKGYVPLDRLEDLLALDEALIHGGNIEIQVGQNKHASLDIRKLDRYSFFINGMKMTDNAVRRQDKNLIPSRTFALCFGRVFRYDTINGISYIDDKTVNAVFVNGEAYSTVEHLNELIDTGGCRFEFKKFAADDTPLFPVINKGPDKRVVALTFDDYLGDEVYPLLDVLDTCGVKCTFFIIGNSIENNGDVLKKLTSMGHEAANHTWDHYNNHSLTDDEIRAQLIATQLFLKKYDANIAPFFRPPGGYYNDNIIRIAQDVGLQTMLWSLNSTDADIKNNARRIKKTVTQWIHPGAIITMHTGRTTTIEALPQIVEELRNRGYEFVTVSEMVKLRGGI